MHPRAHAPQQKPLWWEASVPQLEGSRRSPQLEKSLHSKEEPAQPKTNNDTIFFKKKFLTKKQYRTAFQAEGTACAKALRQQGMAALEGIQEAWVLRSGKWGRPRWAASGCGQKWVCNTGATEGPRGLPVELPPQRLLFEMLFQALMLGTDYCEGREAGQRQGGWEEEAAAGGWQREGQLPCTTTPLFTGEKSFPWGCFMLPGHPPSECPVSFRLMEAPGGWASTRAGICNREE